MTDDVRLLSNFVMLVALAALVALAEALNRQDPDRRGCGLPLR